MNLPCPDCGGTVWMRAIKLVQFSPNWLPWLPPTESHYGYNVACAADGCGFAGRITLSGVQRLRAKVSAAMQAAPAPKDEGPKPRMELHATPGIEWGRGTR